MMLSPRACRSDGGEALVAPGSDERDAAHRDEASGRPLARPRPAASPRIGLTVIVAVAPFLYVLSVSLKQSSTLYQYPPAWIPNPFTLANYRFAIDAYPLLRWLANTIGVALAVTAIKLAMDSMAAYALARMAFRGRRVVTGLMFCAILVPPACLIIPLFFLVRDLGIFDTYWALILPPLANPLGVFMLRAFIHALPPDFEQAARIDGCSAFQIYWRVILPLIRPGLIVVAIYVSCSSIRASCGRWSAPSRSRST